MDRLTLRELQDHVGAWQAEAFGPTLGDAPGGEAQRLNALKHLAEEVEELTRPDADVAEELADVLLLVLGNATRQGIDIALAVEKKMQINRQRVLARGPQGYRKHVAEKSGRGPE